MTQILEHLVYGLFWTLGALIYYTPFAIRDFKARVWAWIFFEVFRFRRNIVLHNLSKVFPRESQESMESFKTRCEALALQNYRHYMHCIFEIFERFHWNESVLGSRVHVVGLENIRNAQAKGQGFFFLSAHLGNWEIITIVGVLIKSRLAIVTKYLRNGFFDRIWKRSRRSFGLELLEEKGSGLAIIRSVREGKGIGFILDQHTGEPHGVTATFLGQAAWCPKGLAILASRLQVPVLPAYLLRQEDGSFVLTIEAPLDFSGIESGKTLSPVEIVKHIQICNANMERWIRRSPEQYLWLHKRFKGTIDYRSPLAWQM